MARKVSYIKSLDNTQPMMEKVQVAANQTIVVGDLLVISSGKVAKAGAAATAVFGIAEANITTGGSPTAADEIPVTIINEKSVLEVSYTGTAIAAAGLFGTAYDITAAQVLDTADVTGGFLLAVKLPNTSKTTQQVVVKRSALWNA